MIPYWLYVASIFALVFGFAAAGVIMIDEMRDPQHMWIMNVVWPVVALFGTVLAVWAYFRYGRRATMEAGMNAKTDAREPSGKSVTPFPVMVGKATLHCGSGCTLGDIGAEWLAFAFPAIAVWFGWHWLFSEKPFAVWVLDFIFAFVIGIAFQYFTIVPMRHLTPTEGVKAALKADALSLTAWQIGMYGFMAFANLYYFPHVFGVRLEVDSVEFWFMMQIAMLCGFFITSYPVNWWLLRSGIKEMM
ncbi:DUF4396 domain-containing protein [Acidithiobacillus ferridurans]|uniref:DUF4396 domain-containing protein n=1 Tax=Acidithiobacillus ferridurans TaxID=1232575 RepID=A0A8X8GAZ1_ACIFI|nr:DUF4396 domain-containing protein [Acidithiobacillus ferridurans]MBU2725533.1 DUF4396 domain-containing protein [Acidithiobacillus ferridurans]